MHNLIVTGATGCVGSAVVRQALARGMNVTCIVHKDSQRLSNLPQSERVHVVISYVIRKLKAGRSPELTKCEQIWDYLYADDAGDAILSVAANGVDGKTYPLGSGQGRKLSEYIEEIRQIINPSVKVQYGVKDYYPHQPMHLVADISELTKDTGWKPKFTFIKGILSFVCNDND